MSADDLTLRVSSCTINPGAALGSDTFTKSNPREIAGWTGVSVHRGIERCPSGFEIEFTEPLPGRSDVVVSPGDFCEVMLGSDLVLTGFVDRYMPAYSARSHAVRISGRSRSQDLVDCSVVTEKGVQFKQESVTQIAKKLAAPYGIEVNLAPGTDDGGPIEVVQVMIGESPYAVIERLCRFRALLIYDAPDGSMIISQSGKITAASGFKEGVNVLSAAAMYSMDGRFSEYEIFLQNLDTFSDIGDGGNLIGRSTDKAVQRFRHRSVIAETAVGSPLIAEARINWEANRRIGRSFQVRLVTDSWRDSSGKPYAPNTLVPIDLPGLKMKPQTWLVGDVGYQKSSGGTTCELTIMPAGAFDPMPFLLYPQYLDVQRVM